MHREDYFNAVLMGTVRPKVLLPQEITAGWLPEAAVGAAGRSQEPLQVQSEPHENHTRTGTDTGLAYSFISMCLKFM